MVGEVNMKWMILALCVWTSVGHAAKIENIDFPEETLVGTQKYVLNGAGIRKKKKLGMNFKVYVGALYLAAKNKNAQEIIAGAQPKILELVFLREIDRETLQDAWKEGYEKNCKDDCAATKAQFKAFNDMMVDVQDGSRLKLTFDKSGVNVEMKAAKTSNVAIDGEAIRRVLMSIFIGDHPPTEDLKKALLGG
jgi:carbonic anhydrase/acetyltransferase-like protein (isoleucine patch superfamily)